jgi:Zn-dependent protease
VAVKILLATGTSLDSTVILFLVSLLSVNVMLFVFNLIPIPPLDGSKFLLAALDSPKYDRLRFNLVTRGPIYLLLLILADSFLLNSAILGTLYNFAFGTVIRIFGLS